MRLNPPPGWPRPPEGWQPPAGWTPDPNWPEPPPGWRLWVPATDEPDAANPLPPPPLDMPAPADGVAESQSEESADASRRMQALAMENAALRARLAEQGPREDEFVILDDERVLQSVGIYRYHHPLENAAAYKDRLDELSNRITEMVRSGQAIEASSMFTYDNSLAKGRRMVTDLSALMLRAYNAEADNSIRSLRVGNVVTAKKRLEASRTAIARLGRMMEMHISDGFHALRVEEIELTADYLMIKQQEKEDAREERARLREERRVAQELAAERERLDKERTHLANALATLRAAGGDDAELAAQLEAIDQAIEDNDYRQANIRAGYVYVISNRGAFGDHVVKIGLTRRLQPLERIAELSGASVPFRFDVHALFFSDDAVTLENELHKHFADRALNQTNLRKEFFFATPAEVRKVLADKVGTALLEFSETAEATEYLQSVSAWPENARPRHAAADHSLFDSASAPPGS
jgi:hypothetical protein